MSSRRAVLIVEDELLIMLAAYQMVEAAGFVAKEALTAESALRILEDDPGIAILFTDIDLPGAMDGLALALQVQLRWPQIHVIITSGRRLLAPHEIPCGAVFLEKPYLSGTLIEACRNMLG